MSEVSRSLVTVEVVLVKKQVVRGTCVLSLLVLTTRPAAAATTTTTTTTATTVRRRPTTTTIIIIITYWNTCWFYFHTCA